MDETSWAQRFTWSEIKDLAKYVRLYDVPEGGILFTEGEQDTWFGLIASGHVEIGKEDLGKERRVLATLGVGKPVGEMSLLDGQPRSATAIATEPTSILLLSREEFGTLSEEHPKTALALVLAIAAAISQRLRQTTGTLVECLPDPGSDRS